MNHQLLQLVKETVIGGDFADNCILQDFIIPIQHIKEAIELNHRATAIYPLWMVPARLHFPSLPHQLLPKAGDVMFVDLGVYGFSGSEKFEGRDKTLRKFEKFTLENLGFQALYAETLMSHDEFCTMFPRSIYEQVPNTSLAASGALAHHLPNKKWPLGGPKMADGVCLSLGFWMLPSSFAK